MLSGDTIAAIATAPGRGGVSVIRISGPDAFKVAGRVCGRAFAASEAGRFFRVSFAHDDGLALIFAAPHSYTGEDTVELQGHGGSVAPRETLEAVLAAGARLATRGEFTLRAFLNGNVDLTKAEAVIDLVDAPTERAAHEAHARIEGALSKPFADLYEKALDVSARIEHALDFSEDELPPDFATQLQRDLENLLKTIRMRLSTAREGRLLREGARVVLAGAPNAGKSSLLNALLGTNRAIVSDIAGTTRDTIEESVEMGGWQVRLVDTAGLHEAQDSIEAEGIARAQNLLREADLVIALDCDKVKCSNVRMFECSNVSSVLHVHAKCDLDDPSTFHGASGGRPHSNIQPFEHSNNSPPLSVSARTGEGLEALRTAIVKHLEALAAKEDDSAQADITTRQKELLEKAAAAIQSALKALLLPEWVVAANEMHAAAESLGRLSGRVYSEDILTALFSRFCIGK